MPKHVILAIPHDLGAAEVRRRLGRQTEWALRRLEKKNIRVAITNWVEGSRAFTARALGQDVSGNLAVAADSLWLEATIPWIIGAFAPAIQAAARHYAGRILAADATA